VEAIHSVSEQGTTAGTVRAFRMLGVPVRLHFTFILLFIFLLVTDLGSRETSASYALFLMGIFASVLLHEMAHAFVARRFGVRTTEIVMFPIGGLSRLERILKPTEELWIAVAGPSVNLLISGLIFAYMFHTRQAVPIRLADLLQPTNANALARLAYGNMMLAGLNLLPAFPMDGGRLLRALLSYVRPEDQATRTAAWMGRMLAISIMLYAMIAGQFMLVFFGVFIWLGAAQEGAAAMGRTLTHGIPIRAAMITEFRTLEHGHTIRDAANLLLSSHQQDFPVVHSGQVVGLLGRNLLLKALAADGPDAYVAGVMDRDFISFEPATDLAEVLPMMARAGRCALVMDGANLTGLLTADNLSEFLLLRRFGMEPVV